MPSSPRPAPTPKLPRILSDEEKENTGILIDYTYNFLAHSENQRPIVNAESLRKWFTEDFVYYDPSWGKPVQGHLGMKEVLDNVRSSFGNFDIRLHRIFPLGDYVTTDWSYGTELVAPYPGFRKINQPVTAQGTTRMRIRKGRMSEMWQIFNCVEDVTGVEVEPDNRRELNLARYATVLSNREIEVFQWLCEAKSNQVIANILGISKRTVDKHCENIFGKLGADNRSHAMALGFIADAEYEPPTKPAQHIG